MPAVAGKVSQVVQRHKVREEQSCCSADADMLPLLRSLEAAHDCALNLESAGGPVRKNPLLTGSPVGSASALRYYTRRYLSSVRPIKQSKQWRVKLSRIGD